MSKKPRIVIVVEAIKDRLQFNRVATETVAAQIECERLVARRDARINTLKALYTARIAAQERIMETNLPLMEKFASSQKEELFGKNKSIKLTDGHEVGWRTGNKRTATLKGWTWKMVVAALLKARKPIREKFLAVKVEADKQTMIEEHKRAKLLARYGVEILQDETFFLDPAREGQAGARIVTEAQEAA